MNNLKMQMVMKKTYTIKNFAKRFVMMLAVGLIAVNAWGTTYTFDFHTSTSGNGGEVTYWYSDEQCKTHVRKYYSAGSPTVHYNRLSSGSPYTMYYKDATITTAKRFVVCSSAADKYAYFNNGTYFIFGQKDSYLTLPTFSGEKITNVTVTTSYYVAGSVNVNVYSGTTAVSTTRTTTANTSSALSFNIASNYQSDELKIKVENAKNFQLIQIDITTAPAGYAITWNNGGHGTAPTSPTNATSLTLSAITGVDVWTCTGWNADVAVTNTSTSASISAGTLIPNGTNVTLSQATTFTAQWETTKYTVSFGVSPAGYGTVSQASVANVPHGTVPTSSTNTVTVNGTTVTATPHAQDADYNYSFSSWSGIPGTVTGAVTITANFTRTARPLTNYRTVCCTALGSINGSISWSNGQATVHCLNTDFAVSSLQYKGHDQGDGSYSTHTTTWTPYDDQGTNDMQSSDAAITSLTAGNEYDFKVSGTYSGSSYCTGSYAFVITSTVPKIMASSSMTDLGYKQGETPEAQTFTITGTQLTGNLTVTAPSNFLVSLDGSSWSAVGGTQTVTVTTPPNDLGTTTIYVKANSGLLKDANPSGNIVISGGGAASVNVPVEATITEACTAPNHVDITGRWDRFGGETISLTATAYSSEGTGSPIAAANITGYQWQKLINTTWTNVTGANVSGETSANLQISNCTTDNSGKYRCVVSTGATCSTASATETDGSEGYGVKVYVLECYTGEPTTYNFTRTGDTQSGSLTLQNLTCNTDYTFKIHADGYYGNNGTICSNVTNWVWSTSGGNCTIKSGYGGDITINIDYSAGGNSSVEGEPEISVTYEDPKTIYVVPGDYATESAKIAIYYWSDGNGGSNGWTDFLSTTTCSSGKLVATLPAWTQHFCIGRFNPDKASTGNWDYKWNQTNDIDISCSYDQYSFSSWCSGDGCKETFTAGTFVPLTYTISFGDNGSDGGSAMSSVAGIACLGSTTLVANTWSKTGYHFDGWKTNAAVTANGTPVAADGIVADEAVLTNISSNITLTAQWAANTNTAYTVKHYKQNIADDDYTEVTADRENLTGTTGASVTPAVKSYTGFTAPNTQTAAILADGSLVISYQYTRNKYDLAWSLDGGSISVAGTPEGKVKYETPLTAPTVTKTGYTFASWSPSVPSTMPAANSTYTATWTINSHTLTWDWNGGSCSGTAGTHYTAGGSVNYGTTISYPDDSYMSRAGYTFAGWSTDATTMPDDNLTITAQWTALTDTYKTGLHTDASGWTAYASGVEMSGANYAIPAPSSVTKGATSSCEDTHYHFAGWVTDANKEAGTISGNIILATGTTDATGTTYWAVWEKEDTGGGDASYVLVESAPDSWAGDYLIVYNNTYALNTHYDNRNTNSYATYSDISSYYTSASKSIASNATTDALAYTIAKTTNGHSISHKEEINSVATDVYLGCNSTNNKGLRWDQPFTVSIDEWTLGVGGITSVDQTGREIRWNNNSGQERFSTYATGGQQAIQLFKYDSGVSYTDPITACAAVTCGAPTSATNTSVTAFGATIGWTDAGAGTASEYEYAVWVHGEVEPTSGYSTAETNSATITGKLSNTQYDWKVRKVCTDTDGNSEFLYSSFTTLGVTLTFSVPEGVDAVGQQSSTSALPSADVPSTCGSCWEFAGWTTSSSVDASSAPATLFAAGDYAHVGSGETTLHAVYMKDEFRLIRELEDMAFPGDYVLSAVASDDSEYALSSVVTTDFAQGVDITDLVQLKDEWYFYNPAANVIWHGTGSASSGKMYNEANGKYLDISATSTSPLKESDTETLKFTENGSVAGTFDVQSNTTTSNYLGFYEGNKFAAEDSHEQYSVYIYKRISTNYATSPSCSTYRVRWFKEDMNTPVLTETVTACDGEISTMPNSSAYALDCTDKFMGWSTKNYGSTLGKDDTDYDDLFTTIDDAPAIDEDKDFYAVFASNDAESATEVDDELTYASIWDGYAASGAYTDFSNVSGTSGAVYAGNLYKMTSGTTIKDVLQMRSSSSAGIITTTSGGNATKVSVTWNSNTADSRTIDIYGKNAAYSSIGDLFDSNQGEKIGSISYDGSNASGEVTLSKKYAFIGIRSNNGALYLDDVTIKWEQAGAKDYVTMCCDKTITIGTPTIVSGEGTVTFTLGGDAISAGDVIETCSSAKNIVATVTPAAGYSCTALSFSGGSVSVDPTPGDGNYPASPASQAYTLTFAKETTAATLSTSVTFAPKALTDWTWKYKKGDVGSADPAAVIPAVVEAYIGEYVRFIIDGYTPSDVIAAKRGYVYDQTADPKQPVYNTDSLAHVGHSTEYYTTRGTKAGDATIKFKAIGDASITKTMTIRSKVLPSVTFVDKLQGKTDFSNWGTDGVVASTLSSGIVTHTKPTPSREADISSPGASYNACEQQHLHLVGWIESSWADAHPNATHSEISGANASNGEGTFLEAGAYFNVETYNGRTYYAVWSIIQ